MTRAAVLLAAALLAACSPAYYARSAGGHARLLWNRRSIERSLADPALDAAFKAKLSLSLEARRFGFETLGLLPSRDYRDWTPVEGQAVTWLVYACPRTRLEAHRFRFPLVGSFPYKGHFRKEHAERDAAALDERGLDAAVIPAAVYNTPLWVADPLPSTVLRYPAGDLVEFVLHELAHGTVWHRGRTDFNEAAASWVGERGAEAFLLARAGAGSADLREWRQAGERAEARAAIMDELAAELRALYASGASEAEKFDRRAAVFDRARRKAAEKGVRLREPLNNAVVIAHTTYRGDRALFDALLKKHGGDWPKTLGALRALDPKDPWAALRAEVSEGR